MKKLVYLSRAFVEFGPFTTEEIKDFNTRGVVRDIDHLRYHGEDDWIPAPAWLAALETPSKPKVKVKATAKPKSPPAAKAANKASAEKSKTKVVKKPKKTD